MDSRWVHTIHSWLSLWDPSPHSGRLLPLAKSQPQLNFLSLWRRSVWAAFWPSMRSFFSAYEIGSRVLPRIVIFTGDLRQRQTKLRDSRSMDLFYKNHWILLGQIQFGFTFFYFFPFLFYWMTYSFFEFLWILCLNSLLIKNNLLKCKHNRILFLFTHPSIYPFNNHYRIFLLSARHCA